MAKIVKLKIIADTKNAEKGMKSIDNSVKNTIKSLIGVTAALYAMKKAFDFATEFKNAARDAVETKQKFEQVFSSMTVAAHNTSQSLQDEFKLASQTAQELLGNTGDLLVGFGFAEEKALSLSRRIGKLALDLRSFKNIQMEASEVTQLMISAMSGNMRAIRSLGVVLRLEDADLKKLIKTYEVKLGYDKKQAVALAVLDEAYNQSFKSIGDFSRTQEQLANKERILEERFKSLRKEIGDELLPLFSDLSDAGLVFADVLSKEIPPLIKQFTEEIDVGEITEDLVVLTKNMLKLSEAAYKNRDAITSLLIGYAGLSITAGIATKVKVLASAFSALTIKGASLVETLRLLGMYAAGAGTAVSAGILAAVAAISAGGVWAVLDAQKAKLEEDLEIGDTIMKLEMLDNVFGKIPKTLAGYESIADPFVKLRNSLQTEYDEVVKSNKKITEYNESAAAHARGGRKLELDTREQDLKENLDKLELLYKKHFENISAGNAYDGYGEYLKSISPEIESVTESIKAQILQYSDLSSEIDKITKQQMGAGTDFLASMGIDVDTSNIEEIQEMIANLQSETIMVQYEAQGLDKAQLAEIRANLELAGIVLGIKLEGLEGSLKEQEKLLDEFYDRVNETTDLNFQERIDAVDKYYTDNKDLLEKAGLDEVEIEAQKTADILAITNEQIAAKKAKSDEWLKFYNDNILSELEYTISANESKLAIAREYVESGKMLSSEYIEFEKSLADNLLEYQMSKWEESHQFRMGILETMFAGYDTFINNMIESDLTYKEKLDAIWDSMRGGFISLLGDMLKEEIKTRVIQAGVDKLFKAEQIISASITGAAIAKAFTPAAIANALATGGTSAWVGAAAFTAAFSNAMGSIPSFADGADFTVPSGYPNDSYQMLVQTGEHVQVTPAGQSNRTDELLEILIIAINNKPVANTVVFDNVDMSRYVEEGNIQRYSN